MAPFLYKIKNNHIESKIILKIPIESYRILKNHDSENPTEYFRILENHAETMRIQKNNRESNRIIEKLTKTQNPRDS